MKRTIWRLTVAAALAGLVVMGSTGTTWAAEGREPQAERKERGEPRPNPMPPPQEHVMRQVGGQLERLEQRLNQMAERQEQFMRQVSGKMERVSAAGPAGRENLRPPMPPAPGVRRPMMPEGAGPVAGPMKTIGDVVGLCVLVWLLCNILLAIWIFTDIRKRGEGPAIFVALALVAGIPAAVIYSLVRIGDRKAPVALP
jgi:hypothetical protein